MSGLIPVVPMCICASGLYDKLPISLLPSCNAGPSTHADIATPAAAAEPLVTPHVIVGGAHHQAARPSRSSEPAIDADGATAPSHAGIAPSHAAEPATSAEQGVSSPQAASTEAEQEQPEVKPQQSQQEKSEQPETEYQDTAQHEPEQQELGHRDWPQPEQLAVVESAVVAVPDTLSRLIPASAWSDPGQVRLSDYDAASLVASLPQNSMTTEQVSMTSFQLTPNMWMEHHCWGGCSRCCWLA